MNAKTTLVLIALIGVGLFALPQTTALFAGQHSFVNIDETGNQIECVKCHGDIQSELKSEHSSLTGTEGPHAEMKCEYCHRLQIGQSSGDSAYALIEYQGQALNLSNGSFPETVRRYMVMKTADYEAQKYPSTITNRGDITNYQAAPRAPATCPIDAICSLVSGATAGASISPIYGNVTLFDYSATVFAWNNSVSNRARQTDVISNGIGVITFVPRATIYPLYKTEGGIGEPIDTNITTKETAFNPVFVTWNLTGITSPTAQPAVILDGAGSRTVNAGSRYHAASLVACMDCHAGASPQPGHETARLGMTKPEDELFCENCHYGSEEPGAIRTYELAAGGFGGITDGKADSGVAEVHNKFTKTQADNLAVGVFGGRMVSANNAACIACHTHVDVEITYSRPTTLVFNANEALDGNWTESGYVGRINTSYDLIDNQTGTPIVLNDGGVTIG